MRLNKVAGDCVSKADEGAIKIICVAWVIEQVHVLLGVGRRSVHYTDTIGWPSTAFASLKTAPGVTIILLIFSSVAHNLPSRARQSISNKRNKRQDKTRQDKTQNKRPQPSLHFTFHSSLSLFISSPLPRRLPQYYQRHQRLQQGLHPRHRRRQRARAGAGAPAGVS